MGTRTLIRVKNHDVMIYQHYDGYPSHVLPWLTNRCIDYLQYRVDEPYFIAYLLKTLLIMPEEYQVNKEIYTGFGVFRDIQKGKNRTKIGDYGSEYLYTVDLKGGKILVEGYSGKKTINLNASTELQDFSQLDNL
jgi:hypothetical protein